MPLKTTLLPGFAIDLNCLVEHLCIATVHFIECGFNFNVDLNPCTFAFYVFALEYKLFVSLSVIITYVDEVRLRREFSRITTLIFHFLKQSDTFCVTAAFTGQHKGKPI